MTTLEDLDLRLQDVERRLAALETLHVIERRLKTLEVNQKMTVEGLQLILTELGIKRRLVEIAENLEAGDSTNPPPPLGHG